MSYDLKFLPSALKEWKKLDSTIREQFKKKLLERLENPHVSSNFKPENNDGKPVIQGTRITVELILEKLAAGESVEQILDEHPRLTRETIKEFSD